MTVLSNWAGVRKVTGWLLRQLVVGGFTSCVFKALLTIAIASDTDVEELLVK